MNTIDNETYKPHWERRPTQKRKAKEKSAFDILCAIASITYLLGMALWMLNDAFPGLFF